MCIGVFVLFFAFVLEFIFMQVEAGNPVCLVEEQPKDPKPKNQANDMITFRSVLPLAKYYS